MITLEMLSKKHQVNDLAMGFKRSILESKIFHFKASCPSTFCSFPFHHKSLILLWDLFFLFILLGKLYVEAAAYITICKIDSQGEFAVWLRKLKPGLCINLGGGTEREVGWRFKREGIYVYLWLIHVEVQQKTVKFCKAIILQ